MIIDNDTLTNISGLLNLISLGGSLAIDNNDILSSLAGMDNLTNIGGFLLIDRNDMLKNLVGLHNVTHIEYGLSISRNDELINLEGLEGVTSVGGPINISENPALKNINQLNNISGDLPEDIDIINNDSLINLIGLNNITSVGFYLWIEDNDALTDLTGLENIASIGYSFVIKDNLNLTSLSGLNNIADIGGLIIKDNISLNDLSSLSNVTSEISLNLEIIGNHSLTSLSGIDKLNLSSIDYLFIHGNDSLSECHVYSVCNFMDDNPYNGYFYYNADGCKYPEEVIAACDTVSVEEYYFEDAFTISPNPCSGFVNLQYTISEQGQPSAKASGVGRLVICDLYEISGIRVKQLLNEERIPGTYEIKIDLSDVPAGIYLCTLKTNPEYSGQTKKLIKL